MEEGPDCFTPHLFLQYNNRATFTRSFEKCAENNALAFKAFGPEIGQRTKSSSQISSVFYNVRFSIYLFTPRLDQAPVHLVAIHPSKSTTFCADHPTAILLFDEYERPSSKGSVQSSRQPTHQERPSQLQLSIRC